MGEPSPPCTSTPIGCSGGNSGHDGGGIDEYWDTICLLVLVVMVMVMVMVMVVVMVMVMVMVTCKG